jgi:hypothetical protein
MRYFLGWFAALAVMGFFTAAATSSGQEKKVPLDKVPKKVLDAVESWFPGAKLTSVEKENEDGKVVFDIELTHKGKKYEMDIHEDGTVIEIEKETAAKDLPEAVTKALDTKFPKATFKEIMEVNKVKDKTLTPIHYEVVVQTAEGKTMEVIVSLDGETIKGEKAEKDKK